MIWGHYGDFEISCAARWHFAKTCSVRPQTCVLWTFRWNGTVFPIWRWFEASRTNLRSSLRQNEILLKRALPGPKRAFCTLFEEIELFSRFCDDLRTVRRFWVLVCGNVRFCLNFLRTTPNENIAISIKSAQTHVWGRTEHVLAKSQFAVQQISSYLPYIIAKSGRQCHFYKKCTKRTFGDVRSKFWQNLSIYEL